MAELGRIAVLRSWLAGLRVLYLALLGLAVAIVSLSDKLAALRDSKLLLHLYIVLDTWRFEIFATLLLLLAIVLLPVRLRDVRDGARWAYRTIGQRTPGSGFALGGVLGVCAGLAFAAPQALNYQRGAEIRRRDSWFRLEARADEALQAGHLELARVNLEACVVAIHDSHCEERLAAYRDRLRRIQALETLYTRVALTSVSKPELRLELSELRVGDPQLEVEVGRLQGHVAALKKRALSICSLAAARQFSEARDALAAYIKREGSSSDLGLFYRDLNGLAKDPLGKLGRQRPFFAAIERYGCDAVVRDTFRPLDEPLLHLVERRDEFLKFVAADEAEPGE